MFPGASEAEANFNFTPGFILRTEYVSGIAGCHSRSLDATHFAFVLKSCSAQATPPRSQPTFHLCSATPVATPPHQYTCFHRSSQASCSFTPLPLGLSFHTDSPPLVSVPLPWYTLCHLDRYSLTSPPAKPTWVWVCTTIIWSNVCQPNTHHEMLISPGWEPKRFTIVIEGLVAPSSPTSLSF